MATEEKMGSATFSWTAPKGLLTVGLFIALAFVSEFFMVSFFAGSGLTEVATSLLPVSLLFYILPLAVIIILVLSWTYLTKNMAMRPRRKSPTKVSKRRRPTRRRSRKSKSTAMGTAKNVLAKIGSVLGSGGSSSVPRRLSFGRVALESAVTVLTVFLLAIILLSVLVYPNLFTDFAVGFYSKTAALQGFLRSLAEGLVSIFSGLESVAPGFRSAFDGLVSSSWVSLSGEDLLWRYVFCQNAAALISAISVLVYVRYFSGVRNIR
jgi:hypothetical protein